MTEKEETEKQNGLEKVLNYFPDASLYQFGLFIYCYYGYMGVATAIAGNIFYQYTPKFECDISSSSMYHPNTSDSWNADVHEFAFKDMTKREARCEYYEPVNCDLNLMELSQCYENATRTKCENYVYNDLVFNDTLVKEYDLVCDKGSFPKIFILLFNVGLTFGPIIAGKASDKFGRTKTIAFGAGVSIILNMIIGFFDVGVWGYAIMRIFIVVFSLLLALSSMVYPSEVLTPKYRSIGSMLVVATALGAGVLLVVLAAYFIRDWRTLHLVVSLVNLPSVFAPLLIPESYRWLYQQGRYDEAEEALLLMSKRAGGTVDARILAEIRKELEDAQAIVDAQDVPAVEASIGENARLKRITLILAFAQCFRGLVQFYLLYTVASLGGDFWVSNIINNFIGFPAAFLMIFMMNTKKFGRRGTFVFGLLCIVVSQGLRLISIFTENVPLAMCSSYLGLFGAMGAMAVGQAYTAELFPTSIRLKATGIIYTGAMAGAFIVPFWMIIDAKISWITTCINFAGICFCAFISLALPETLGKPMTETIADFERLYEQNDVGSINAGEDLTLKGPDDETNI